MPLNARQKLLKEMIDGEWYPRVVDATSIWDKDEDNIPFHWGDIENIGYGFTSRYIDRMGNKYLTRHYNGPNPIFLGGKKMVKGDAFGDE